MQSQWAIDYNGGMLRLSVLLLSTILSSNVGSQIRFGSFQNPYQSCIVDICATPSEFLPLLNRQRDGRLVTPPRNTDLLQEARERLSRIIQDYFALSSRNTFDERWIQDISDAIFRMKKEGVPDGVKTLPLELFFSDIGLALRHQKKAIDGKSYIDRSFVSNLNELERARFSFLANRLDSYLSDRERYADVLHTNHKIFFATRYPHRQSIHDAIGQHLRRLTEMIEEAKRISLAPHNLSEVDLHLFNRRFSEGRLSPQELSMLLEEDSTFNLLAIALEYRERYHDSLLNELKAKVHSWLADKSEDAIASSLSRTVDNAPAQKHAEDICLGELEENFFSLPYPHQKDSLKNTAEQAREDFFRNLDIFEGLSQNSKNTVEAAMQNSVFLLPLTFAEWTGIVFEHLDYFTRSLRESGKSITRNFNAEEYAFSLASLYIPRGEYSTMANGTQKSKISQLCQRFKRGAIDSGILPLSNSIRLTYLVAQMAPPNQKGIVFHEMAHGLHRFLEDSESLDEHTKTSYNDLKRCLMGTHTQMNTSNSGREYFSEDFADLIATKMLPPKTTPRFCHYLSYSKRRRIYLNHNLSNQEEDDPHSSPLFRLLRAHLGSFETIPVSCQTPLRRDGVFSFPPYCHF